MSTPRTEWFVAGDRGSWNIAQITAIIGPPLPPARQMSVRDDFTGLRADEQWVLRGVTSNHRYTEAREKALLKAREPPLNLVPATRAALIPIRKSEAWWGLAQDQRRAIFEQSSAHIATGLKYLPVISRTLYHCRDLGGEFDFLTWFEFANDEERLFDELVDILRQTEEWTYVEREVDIRLHQVNYARTSLGGPQGPVQGVSPKCG